MRADRVDAVGRRAMLRVAVTLATIVAVSELLHRRASRRGFAPADPSAPNGTEAVVVLGCPAKKNGQPHPMQRWRCQIAARSLDPARTDIIVFTGGAVERDQAEADVMACYAHESLGIPESRTATETKSESTWQNIEFTLPLIEHADRILIASDPMHAARARRYLTLQRPDLAPRLTPTDDYRPLERWWLKIPTAAYELTAIARRRAGHALLRHG
ncbi:YdcF family protein [Nocardia terpenica]|uniref:YdcF family protein n=1 Tax=Nocardia terpenica TaxID=455432 RepID=UPI001558DB25|nr:YdcF family protein [Nocardia terpenica]NQE87249.1 YdcF family protein [Nocardia terpenica]